MNSLYLGKLLFTFIVVFVAFLLQVVTSEEGSNQVSPSSGLSSGQNQFVKAPSVGGTAPPRRDGWAARRRQPDASPYHRNQHPKTKTSRRKPTRPRKDLKKKALVDAQGIGEVISGQESLQKFMEIATTLEVQDLFNLQDITVLAISNDIEVSQWQAEIAADPDKAKHIDRFKRHVLSEPYTFEMLDNIQPVPTMSEEILVIAHRDGGRIVVFDDDSTELGQIVTTDLEASNGVVHIVDRVLVRHEDTPRA